jgi:DNA-binding GntR family transcriptional regulator
MARAARRVILVDDVYESIKSMIMDHEVPPDDRISIEALARELEVSPTPVREALARLEADGLVVKRAMVGYATSPLLNRDQFEELFEMRTLLECTAAARAAERITPGTAVELAEEGRPPTVSTVERYADSAPFTIQDARFHDLIAFIAGSEMLRAAINRLHSHLHLHRLHFPAVDADVTAVEHAAIVKAIAAGDPVAAERAMHAHLDESRELHSTVDPHRPRVGGQVA